MYKDVKVLVIGMIRMPDDTHCSIFDFSLIM